MRLNYNIASLNIYRNQQKNLAVQDKALNNLSSGMRVRKAKDDPNALAKSERMNLQIKGMQMANKSVQDGISMLQNVDGALDSVTSMLQRIKELTVQAGGVTNDDDKAAIQKEIGQMVQGIDDAVKDNEFNGVKLINNETSEQSLSMASGANAGDSIEIPLFKLTSDMIGDDASGKKLSDINVIGDGGVDDAINIVNGALDTVNSVRSKYGALENRFESQYSNLDNVDVVVQGAQSNLVDSDIASEMADYSRMGILIQAGTAMMAQTNKFPQDVLNILSQIK